MFKGSYLKNVCISDKKKLYLGCNVQYIVL